MSNSEFLNLDYFLNNYEWRIDTTCYHLTYILRSHITKKYEWYVQLGPCWDYIIKPHFLLHRSNDPYELTAEEREYLQLKLS